MHLKDDIVVLTISLDDRSIRDNTKRDQILGTDWGRKKGDWLFILKRARENSLIKCECVRR